MTYKSHYNPTAVELHVALDLFSEIPENIVLTPDTNAEAQYLPKPEQLENTLIMGDRGYFQKDYMHRVFNRKVFFASMFPYLIHPWNQLNHELIHKAC